MKWRKIMALLWHHYKELMPQIIILPYIYIFHFVMNNFYVVIIKLIFLSNIRSLLPLVNSFNAEVSNPINQHTKFIHDCLLFNNIFHHSELLGCLPMWWRSLRDTMFWPPCGWNRLRSLVRKFCNRHSMMKSRIF